MSEPSLLHTFEQMLEQHQQLLQVAKQKQVALKEQDVHSLATILREEQKHVTAIQIIETRRQKLVEQVTGMNQPSFEQLLSIIKDDQRQVEAVYEQLHDVIMKLKEQNELNQQLLKMSLQFIHLNLDLLSPEQTIDNYSQSRDDEKQESTTHQSIFDSKA